MKTWDGFGLFTYLNILERAGVPIKKVFTYLNTLKRAEVPIKKCLHI